MTLPVRNGLVDHGRLVAALGIVWFHTDAPGDRIAYAMLPFFLVLLAIPSRTTTGMRAQRLLVPFLQWSIVYAVVEIGLALHRHTAPLAWWDWNMLLAGTSTHLWFLTFAFFVQVLAPVFRPSLIAPAAALAVALALGVLGTPATVPLAQWSFGVIPVLVGFTYFAAGWRIATATLLLSWLILLFCRPSPDNATILIGTALALLVLSLPIPSNRWTDWCARISMWVYVAHPLVIIAGQTAGLSGYLIGVFSVVGSVALAQCMEAARQFVPRFRQIRNAWIRLANLV